MKHFVPPFLYYWSHLGPEQTSAAVTAILQTQLRLPPELRLRPSPPHRSASTPLPILTLCPFSSPASSPSRHQNIQIFCSKRRHFNTYCICLRICVCLCVCIAVLPRHSFPTEGGDSCQILGRGAPQTKCSLSVFHRQRFAHTHTHTRCGMKR